VAERGGVGWLGGIPKGGNGLGRASELSAYVSMSEKTAYKFPETRCVGMCVLGFTLLSVVSSVGRGGGLGGTSSRTTFFRSINEMFISLILWLDEHALESGSRGE
jgi:hypothetical protein